MRWYHHIIAIGISLLVNLEKLLLLMYFPIYPAGTIAEVIGGYVGSLAMIWVVDKAKNRFKK